MADCLELRLGSLYMDQLLRELPDLREWIAEFKLKNRFFMYTEYNEPRYCFEMHEEDDEMLVHVIKLTDDVEFFGDLLKQIKKHIYDPDTKITIIMEEESRTLWRQLWWKKWTKEIEVDMYNRKRVFYKSKR